jgi:NADPH-dependent 2,4-dienoyl-CoA reductase/sulfur reductase-like enzyme
VPVCFRQDIDNQTEVLAVSVSAPAKRVVIVGGVAGGMSTATRLRRLDADASITILERSGHVSFANCGLPYFVGGLIEEEDDLTLQTPEQLFDRFRLDARINDEVIAIDRVGHTVRTRSTLTGAESDIVYDTLVLSTGAAPVRPPIPGYERVRTLRTVEDAARLVSDVDVAPKTAVVIGAGFIGLEMAENLVGQGIDVTIVEATPQVLPPFDPELAILVRDELEAHGVHVETGATVASIDERAVTMADGRSLDADLVVGAIGVRPDVALAQQAGLALGPKGGLAVNEANQTNDPDIYAVGDAVEKADAISHATSLIALANVANRQGRRVADHIAGRPSHPVPSLGTAIVKVFDLVAATVGWSERRLREAGRPFRAIHSHPFDHATYFPGATRMAAKLIFDPTDGTILGAQIVGRSGVDKRIDVIATAMAGGLSAGRLADLELAYAPPFSSAKDPVNLLGYMAENVLSGDCDVVGPDEAESLVAQGWALVDVRTAGEHAEGAIPGSTNVPVDLLRDNVDALGTRPVVIYCEVGATRRRPSCTSWGSRRATSTAAIRRGWRGVEPNNRARRSSHNPAADVLPFALATYRPSLTSSSIRERMDWSSSVAACCGGGCARLQFLIAAVTLAPPRPSTANGNNHASRLNPDREGDASTPSPKSATNWSSTCGGVIPCPR